MIVYNLVQKVTIRSTAEDVNKAFGGGWISCVTKIMVDRSLCNMTNTIISVIKEHAKWNDITK